MNVGDIVVLQKHISGKKSLFYGQTVIYLGNTSQWISLFRLKRNVNVRENRHRTDYVPRLHHIVSFPLGINWSFTDPQGRDIGQTMPSIHKMGWEYFAQDSYVDVTPEWEDKDYLELDIEIPTTDFAFIKNQDFNDFIERQRVLQFIEAEPWIELYMPVAKKVSRVPDMVWGRKATVELEQVFNENTTSYLPNSWMASYFQKDIIYKLHNGDMGNMNVATTGAAYPMTYCRWQAPRGKFTHQELTFDIHNDPAYDECLVSVWQVINFVYYPTLPGYPSSEQNIPREFYIGTSPQPASEDVEYISEWESWTIVQARTHQSSAVSPDFPRWRSIRSDDPQTAENFVSTYTLNYDSGPLPTSGFNSTSEMLAHITALKQPSMKPLKYDLEQWDIVYLNPEHIGNKMHRKYREYIVISFWWNDWAGNQVYKIQPANKKTFNWEWAIEMRAKHLLKAEKITKRKFTLAEDFGKYKAGQTFTRDEMIQIFGKFQDARDPFILNKLYICAE